ncbi:MAG TPA: hypothetical protein VFQ22_14545, partial [Longimicrobiales bacterium]|nr:hypothetical protein [Longimicrobiales bacterium]
FGYAYYAENAQGLKLVAVDGGAGCVAPSDRTIDDGTYAPLARPLTVYVSHGSLARPVVRSYVELLLTRAAEIVPSTGYRPMAPEVYTEALSSLLEAAGGAG